MIGVLALAMAVLTDADRLTPEQRQQEYPPAAIDRGDQGSAVTSFEIDTEGHPRNCRVITSSGSPDLDSGACIAVTVPGDFKPTTDAAGTVTRKVHFILFDEPLSPKMLAVGHGDRFVIRERHPAKDLPMPPVGPPNMVAMGIGDVAAIRSEDYPLDAWYKRVQGAVLVAYRIGQEGRITACRVLTSSGFASLDKAACKILSQRLRFQPATDAEGRPVTSFGHRIVNWAL